MKYLLLLSLLFTFNLSAKETKQWFEGGTLHKALVTEWNSSTIANQLATSADWLLATDQGKEVAKADLSAMALKLLSIELASCVDEIAISPTMQKETANKVAAVCLVGLGIN